VIPTGLKIFVFVLFSLVLTQKIYPEYELFIKQSSKENKARKNKIVEILYISTIVWYLFVTLIYMSLEPIRTKKSKAWQQSIISYQQRR
jgi:heme/copper-type cytochrome/quinol oxidase subunit 2